MKTLSAKFEKLLLPAVTALAAILLLFLLASEAASVKHIQSDTSSTIIRAGNDAEIIEQNTTNGLLRFQSREESVRKNGLQRETPEDFHSAEYLVREDNTGIVYTSPSGSPATAHLVLTRPIRAGPRTTALTA